MDFIRKTVNYLPKSDKVCVTFLFYADDKSSLLYGEVHSQNTPQDISGAPNNVYNVKGVDISKFYVSICSALYLN